MMKKLLIKLDPITMAKLHARELTYVYKDKHGNLHEVCGIYYSTAEEFYEELDRLKRNIKVFRETIVSLQVKKAYLL